MWVYLEIDDVEIIAKAFAKNLHGVDRQPGIVRNIQRDEPLNPLRQTHGHVPEHQRTPVMRYEDCRINFKRVEQAFNIGDEFLDRIGTDLFRGRSLSATTLVRGDGPITGRGEGGQLVAP